jgi:hypothetical protein
MGRGRAGSSGGKGHLVGADYSILFGKASKKGDSTPSSHVVTFVDDSAGDTVSNAKESSAGFAKRRVPPGLQKVRHLVTMLTQSKFYEGLVRIKILK